MSPSQAPRTRFLTRGKIIPLALFGLGVLLWIGAAFVVTSRLLHPPFLNGEYGDTIVDATKVPASPQLDVDPRTCCSAPFEDMHISADSGASVDAWFVPGTLPSAVLLIPASGASKRAMLPYLKFLHAVGLPVLMLDSSDVIRERAGWGWGERAIVRNAVESLRAKGFTNIAALGVSEGAAAALIAQGEHPELFKVIIADSSFASLGTMLRRNPVLAGLNPAFLATVMWELGRALGRSVDAISPASSAASLGDCALLLIQDEKDPLTPESDGGKILAARASDSSAIFIAESAGHGDGIYIDPQGYRRTVLEFLAHNLPGASTVAGAPH